MYEKILQKLKEARVKNSQISDETLQAQATMLSTVITTDEVLATLEPKIVLDNIQQNINKIAKEVVQSQPVPAPVPAPTPAPTPIIPNEMEDRLQKLEEANAKLQKTSELARQALISERRNARMGTLLQDLSDERRQEVLADYGMMSFADDDAFETFYTRKSVSIGKEVEALRAKPFDMPIPTSVVIDPNDIKEPDMIAEARKLVQPPKED